MATEKKGCSLSEAVMRSAQKEADAIKREIDLAAEKRTRRLPRRRAGNRAPPQREDCPKRVRACRTERRGNRRTPAAAVYPPRSADGGSF